MPERKSVIFAGTPDFALPSLVALLSDPAFRVELVITQPDKPVGRNRILTPPPVKVLAAEHGIEVFQPKDINAEFPQRRAFLQNAQTPDFIITVAYGQLLSPEILRLPSFAPVNVHASLLPRWRGAAPIQNAILAGDRETGVTVQRMAERVDAGPIFAQARIPIDERETAVSLRGKLAELGARLLMEALKEPLRETPQEESAALRCRKLTREDGLAAPERMTAEEIDRRVRALVPWPGVQCTIEGKSVKLIETSLSPDSSAIPLPCAGGTTLYLLKLQSPGKRVMTGIEWLRGKKSPQP